MTSATLRHHARWAIVAVLCLAAAISCVPPAPASAPAGVLRLPIQTLPEVMDPAVLGQPDQLAIAGLVYQPVFRVDPALQLLDGAATVPRIGDGIAPDGLTYTIRLTDTARWSDGQRVTAQQYADAIRRILDPRTQSPHAAQFINVAGATPLVQARLADDLDPAPLLAAVGVRARDDRTLEIRLERQDADLLYTLAEPFLAPWRGEESVRLATGWYRLDRLDGRQARLTLNPAYVGARPAIGEVQFLVPAIPDTFQAFRAGEVDMAPVPTAERPAVLADAAVRPQLQVVRQLTVFGIQMNALAPPLRDPAIRQAISLAIDRTAYIAAFEGGVGQPAGGVIPAGMPGYSGAPDQASAFDPARGRALLTPERRALLSASPLIISWADPPQRARAEWLAQQLQANLGIAAAVEAVNPQTFSDFYNSGQLQVIITGYGATCPDPSCLLPIFRSDSPQFRGWMPPGPLDAQIDAALADPDPARRQAQWDAIQTGIDQQVVLALTHYGARLWQVSPALEGLIPTAGDPYPGIRQLDRARLVRGEP